MNILKQLGEGLIWANQEILKLSKNEVFFINFFIRNLRLLYLDEKTNVQ